MAQEGPIASAAPPASSVGSTQIIDGQVALVDMANLASDRLIGRDTAGSGVPEALTVGGGVEFTGSGGIQRSALTGDVTASAGSNATTIANLAVTDAKVAAANKDGVAGTASMRTLGTGAQQAAAGNHDHAATYQPLDADLTALAASAATAGLVERTGAATYDTRLLGVAADTSVPTRADADARYQPLDATLTNLATMGTAADRILYTTGVDTFAEAAITAGARAFVAGTATAAQVAALGAEAAWTRVVLGSDFTTSNAAATAITGLAFAPAASTMYEVEAMLLLRESSLGVAARPGVAWNTGNDDGVALLTSPEGTGLSQSSGNIGADFSHDAVSTGDDIAESWPCTVKATIVAGGTPAGNFQLTVKSETGGTNVSVKKGSWIRHRAIS